MDPRTSISQCLQAIVTAELTDNAGWEMLSELAGEMGYSEMTEQFEEALTEEEEHLLNVQMWLRERVMAKAASEKELKRQRNKVLAAPRRRICFSTPPSEARP